MDKTKSLNGKTLTRLGRSISHFNPARRLIFLAEPMFCLSDGSPSLVKKCRKP